MKAGDPLDCPHCGKSSFLKKVSVMDGWKKVGEEFQCAACSARIGVAEEAPSSDDALKAEKADKASDALSSLLGISRDDVKTSCDAFKDEEKHFCRDCAYRVTNAFRIYCSKHDKDVNSMDDCADFIRRKD